MVVVVGMGKEEEVGMGMVVMEMVVMEMEVVVRRSLAAEEVETAGSAE
jgi:hypothetical protein